MMSKKWALALKTVSEGAPVATNNVTLMWTSTVTIYATLITQTKARYARLGCRVS